MSYGVGDRCGSDLALLWLWCRPTAAAPIQPLAWEFPYVTGTTLRRQKKKKKKIPNDFHFVLSPENHGASPGYGPFFPLAWKNQGHF